MLRGKQLTELAIITVMLTGLVAMALTLPHIMAPFSTTYPAGGSHGHARQIDNDEVEVEVELSWTRSIQVEDSRWSWGPTERTVKLTADLRDQEPVKTWREQGYGIVWIKPVELSFRYEFEDDGRWAWQKSEHRWKVWVNGHLVDGLYKSVKNEAKDKHYDLSIGELEAVKAVVKIYVMAHTTWQTSHAWTRISDVKLELVVRLQAGHQEPSEDTGSSGSGDSGDGSGSGGGSGGGGGGGQPPEWPKQESWVEWNRPVIAVLGLTGLVASLAILALLAVKGAKKR